MDGLHSRPLNIGSMERALDPVQRDLVVKVRYVSDQDMGEDFVGC